jgi:hypothetical protein
MSKRNIKNHDNNLNPEEVLDKCPCALDYEILQSMMKAS